LPQAQALLHAKAKQVPEQVLLTELHAVAEALVELVNALRH
jgi:hypothetical protein